MKHNLLILLGGIVIIFALFIAGAFINSRPLAHELIPYSSEEGISFSYSDNYLLSSHREGNEERQWDALILIDKDLASSTPEGGEGPPAIALSIFDNQEETPLETWVRTTSYSNFKLSTNGALTSTIVAGEPAFVYRYSGLYENDAVAVAHNNKIYLLSAAWANAGDPIRNDFQELIRSVQFTQ